MIDFSDIRGIMESTARRFLFEFNDEYTREQYKKEVSSRISIMNPAFEYLLICDETNNTPEVIDNNEFVAELVANNGIDGNYKKLKLEVKPSGNEFEEID